MKNKEKIKLIMLVLVLPIFLISIISTYAVTELLSSEVSYDRSTSKLRSNNVQDAIDELNNKYKNAEELKCPAGKKCTKLPSITFDANGGKFESNKDENIVYYKLSSKISKTSNVDDEGNKTGVMPQASSGITDTVTIEGADMLKIEITYQTYSSSYSWVTINNDTSYYGTTKTTTTYLTEGNTVEFVFYNKGLTTSYNDYYGYYAKVTGIKKVSGTYKEPTKENYAFREWNTKSDGSGTSYIGSIYESEIKASSNVENSGNITLYAIYSDYICKRATTLYQRSCLSDSGYGCQGAGISSGSLITHGQIGTSGTLASGDTFNCDVNGDGTYDKIFYYVSDYYDTQNKQFNSDVATLIFASNVSGGNASNTTGYAYYGVSNSYNNYSGPQNGSEYAYYQLPSTSEWSNIKLYRTRAILNEQGGNTTNSGSNSLPTNYSYPGKAARFLTTQELESACNITVGSQTTGELDNCEYLMAGTMYAYNKWKAGYWLETPFSSNDKSVWVVNGLSRIINTFQAYNTGYGARPAIEIPKSQIDY